MEDKAYQAITWSIIRIPVFGSAFINGYYYWTWAPEGVMAIVLALTMFTIDLFKPGLFRPGPARLLRISAGLVLVVVSLFAAFGSFVNGRSSELATQQEAQTRLEQIATELRHNQSTVSQKQQSVASLEDLVEQKQVEVQEAVREQKLPSHCGPATKPAVVGPKCQGALDDEAKARTDLKRLQGQLEEARSAAITAETYETERKERLEEEREEIKGTATDIDGTALVLSETTGVSLSITVAIPAILLIIGVEIAANFIPNYCRVPSLGDITKGEIATEERELTVDEQIIQMRAKGYTQAAIGEVVGLSQSQVSRRLQDLKEEVKEAKKTMHRAAA